MKAVLVSQFRVIEKRRKERSIWIIVTRKIGIYATNIKTFLIEFKKVFVVLKYSVLASDQI